MSSDGQQECTISSLPDASGATFRDEVSTVGMIAGKLSVFAASDETTVASYEIYLNSVATKPTQTEAWSATGRNAMYLGSIAADGSASYTFTLAETQTLAVGQNWFFIVTSKSSLNSGYENIAGVSVLAEDRGYTLTSTGTFTQTGKALRSKNKNAVQLSDLSVTLVDASGNPGSNEVGGLQCTLSIDSASKVLAGGVTSSVIADGVPDALYLTSVGGEDETSADVPALFGVGVVATTTAEGVATFSAYLGVTSSMVLTLHVTCQDSAVPLSFEFLRTIAVKQIVGTMSLAGYSSDETSPDYFDDAARTSFKNALAAKLGADVSQITLAVSGRRRLAAGDEISVQFAVEAASEEEATAAQTAAEAVVTDATEFTTAFETEVTKAGGALPAAFVVTPQAVVIEETLESTITLSWAGEWANPGGAIYIDSSSKLLIDSAGIGPTVSLSDTDGNPTAVSEGMECALTIYEARPTDGTYLVQAGTAAAGVEIKDLPSLYGAGVTVSDIPTIQTSVTFNPVNINTAKAMSIKLRATCSGTAVPAQSGDIHRPCEACVAGQVHLSQLLKTSCSINFVLVLCTI